LIIPKRRLNPRRRKVNWAYPP